MTLVEQMAIEHACIRLIQRFALLNDAADWTTLVSLFAEDGSFSRPTDPSTAIVGRPALLRSFGSRPPRLTCHLISNPVISVESERTASGSSRLILFTAVPVADGALAVADPNHFIGGFEDRFVLTAEGWRFAERKGSLIMRTRAP